MCPAFWAGEERYGGRILHVWLVIYFLDCTLLKNVFATEPQLIMFDHNEHDGFNNKVGSPLSRGSLVVRCFVVVNKLSPHLHVM